jgi:GDPmannose 4,6-dehydratase
VAHDATTGEPDDYVIGTGIQHSVRDFLELAFQAAGLDDRTRYIREDDRFVRPADVDELVADASKARRVLSWKPMVSFEELVRTMVEADLQLEAEKLRRARAT